MKFIDVVNAYKAKSSDDNQPCLYEFLQKKDLFDEILENKLCTHKELQHLLDIIDRDYEASLLTQNQSLMRYMYEHCLLSTKHIENFNTLLFSYRTWIDELKNKDFFEFVEFFATHHFDHKELSLDARKIQDIDCSLVKLNEAHKYAYKFEFDAEEKLKLIERLKNNETALNRLKYIVDNHLESNYDFEFLMRYLNKREKKNLVNI